MNPLSNDFSAFFALHRTLARWAFACVLAGIGTGCAAGGTASSSTSATRQGEPIGLLIQGYNYTDDYIDSFTVNGAGGGNVFASGPLSGGGGSVCCFTYVPGTLLPIKLKVRWTSNYCLYKKTNQYGETYENRRSIWKEADALLTQPPQGNPQALEVHFYPDGHVEAAITEGYSPPRLKLARDDQLQRIGVKHDYPWCTDEQLQ